MEISDKLALGKKNFNVNSLTKNNGKYDLERMAKKRMANRSLNVITGRQQEILQNGSKASNGRQSMLPPSKDYPNSGLGNQ